MTGRQEVVKKKGGGGGKRKEREKNPTDKRSLKKIIMPRLYFNTRKTPCSGFTLGLLWLEVHPWKGCFH